MATTCVQVSIILSLVAACAGSSTNSSSQQARAPTEPTQTEQPSEQSEPMTQPQRTDAEIIKWAEALGALPSEMDREVYSLVNVQRDQTLDDRKDVISISFGVPMIMVPKGRSFVSSFGVNLSPEGQILMSYRGTAQDDESGPTPTDTVFYQETRDIKKALAFVADALAKGGDQGVYGDLSGGLESLSKELHIVFIERADFYDFTMVPYNSGGHEFGGSINKATGKIGAVAVGHSIPPP